MTFKRTSQHIGSSFENYLEGVFKQLQKEYGFRYHRFVDSKDAGGIVASQPADYLFASDLEVGFIEAKASTTAKRLQLSMLRPAQKGAMRYYGQLLGRTYLIIFFNEAEDIISVYDGREVMRGSKINHDKSILFRGDKKLLLDSLVHLLELNPLAKCLKDLEKYQ